MNRFASMAAAAFLAACLTVSAPAAAQWTPADEQAATAVLNGLLQSNQTTALSVAVSLNGKVVMARGFGPGITQNTPFPIGSLSKQFTAAAVLMLIERNALVSFTGKPVTLDSPVQHFFTAVDHWNVMGAPVTLRQLLNMRSNIPSYTETAILNVSVPLTPFAPPTALAPQQPVAADLLLQGIKRLPIAGPAGAYHYSNTNYFLLAHVVEGLAPTAQGQLGDYRSFIATNIFAPAGMKSSGFLTQPTAPGSPGQWPVGPEAFNRPEWPKGAGQIYSTVMDIQAWNRLLMSGKLLNKASLQAMTQPAVPIPPQQGGGAYAMGWVVRSFPAAQEISHAGSISGFSAFNLIATSNAGAQASVTLLANGNLSLEGLARNLAQAALF